MDSQAWLPDVGQQFANAAAGRGGRQAAQDVREVREGLDARALAGGDDAHPLDGGLPAGLAAAEQQGKDMMLKATGCMMAATKYCDVLSINRYRFSPSDLVMVEGADLPIIIGEFHFGALDRGMIHTGLCGVASQRQRAYAYEHYVEQALKHSHIVGTHWFQLRDQDMAGRGDGENYQIGFVDICDTPYPETIDASRRIGEKMCPYRSDAK